jgi:hypothetical protein
MALTSAQIRAARALIRWSAEDLSRHSSVSLRTIRRAELAEGETSMTAANDLALRHALESAGVEFTNGDQPGVRVSKAAAASHAVMAVPREQARSAATKPVRGKTAKVAERKK